ncbi:hypothetical protein [Roseimicrobium sp. ORNL1]|uniref:hypothetical protein n=1 Tax=Roseimicrobium sp. ORNL1 TaxID=2711231 RepID=UPI0013E153DB|nr:hypothetical protein [Roseimicrobium sp. ORNL1]QIF02174.1 hypothetical protein G5S37_11740 [Roseimicrobium sp. ORNL1]
MTREQLEYLAVQVAHILTRLEGGLSLFKAEGVSTFSSIEEALFLAHKFQRLPFNSEQYRLLIEPAIVGLERMAEIHSEMGRKKSEVYKDERLAAIRALKELALRIRIKRESVAPW